jgi:hypothetical protein
LAETWGRELIGQIYRAIETKQPQPISLAEIDAVAKLVDSFTKPALQL